MIIITLVLSFLFQKLMKLILRDKEEVNKVEKGRHGYGAIHYISEGKHEFKRELLVVLAIHGGADLDLTTTHKEQMTALHLAIEVSLKMHCTCTLTK